MTEVYIGLGSNLTNKEENIKKAINLLEQKCKILKLSSLYKTEPVGYKNQDWFLNCVVKVKTGLGPKKLLVFLQSIEKRLKRVKTIKNGPRVIDLDILFYGKKIINESRLVIPHPQLHKRLFVLRPLQNLCPDFIHPVLQKSVNELLSILNNPEKVEFYKNCARQ